MPIYNRKVFENRLQENLQNGRIANNLDVLIYLDYVLFMKRLAEVSSSTAIQQEAGIQHRGLIHISDKHIEENVEQVLREFRG